MKTGDYGQPRGWYKYPSALLASVIANLLLSFIDAFQNLRLGFFSSSYGLSIPNDKWIMSAVPFMWFLFLCKSALFSLSYLNYFSYQTAFPPLISIIHFVAVVLFISISLSVVYFLCYFVFLRIYRYPWFVLVPWSISFLLCWTFSLLSSILLSMRLQVTKFDEQQLVKSNTINSKLFM